MKKISFREFLESDVEKMTQVMKQAFDYDFQINNMGEEGGPEGYDNGEFLRKNALDEEATSFVISYGEEEIGVVILWIKNDQKNYLGCLFIEPRFEDNGLGTLIFKKIEEMYPKTKSWETTTPIYSRKNQNFYINKLGFHAIRIINPKDLKEGQFVLKKVY